MGVKLTQSVINRFKHIARSLPPIVRWVTKTYERGVKVGKKAYRPIAQRLQRHDTLSAWSVTIQPLATESS